MISTRPRATLRLQLYKDFTFDHARERVAYLASLGISHVYASPILTATPGSIHGYDVVDATRVNPELGGEDALRRFVAALRSAGLGLVVDIVPNHMAVGGLQNRWWADVLQYGRDSHYAGFFDIDWDVDDPGLRGKVLAPFLGRPYGDALDAGEIRLSVGPNGQPVIAYFDNLFPIRPSDYDWIRQSGPSAFDPTLQGGREKIHALLERQHYRLAWWGTAGDEINWRRFFDINGLAGLRMELAEVFEATHATLFRLYTEGLIDGFRIDHIDGLCDPAGYCRRLRRTLDELAARRPMSAAQGEPYIVVEKILAGDEQLPSDWGVDGTSGYDFMNEVSALQHDEAGRPALEALWHEATGRPASFEPEETAARYEILESGFSAQLHALSGTLHRVAREDIHNRDVSRAAIRRGLSHVLAHFPVYRTYSAGEKRSDQDEAAFQTALRGARAASPASVHATLGHLDQWLGKVPTADVTWKRAQTQFQQLSAPIAAKAVEDTAFYRYGRLLSRNDVGFDAARLGGSVQDFHQACRRRLAAFPDAMLATATHDHKRGEDVRARLAVISEIPGDWSEFVSQCQTIEAERPDTAAELMLYQMVVGAWPLDLSPADEPGCRAFAERLAGWQRKALREAKLRTSWASPDPDYERCAEDFLHAVVRTGSPFQPLVQAFIDRIASAGAVNGLVQATLKMTVPGMPDFFQGTEFWDFSLVDPDNRRPVDYPGREAGMAAGVLPRDLLGSWRDGRIKQSVVSTVLALRRRAPEVFVRGEYIPLEVRGRLSRHFIAFTRRNGDTQVILLLPRLPTALQPSARDLRLDRTLLADTTMLIPAELVGTEFRSVFTGQDVRLETEMPVAAMLDSFMLCMLAPGKLS